MGTCLLRVGEGLGARAISPPRVPLVCRTGEELSFFHLFTLAPPVGNSGGSRGLPVLRSFLVPAFLQCVLEGK